MSGQLVDVVHTGPSDRAEWARSRGAALLRGWRRRTRDPRLLRTLVLASLAMWARECGWGAGEYNFNGANIRQARWSGDYCNRTDNGRTVPFRAYADLDAAVDDYLQHLAGHRYGPALADLVGPGEGHGDIARWYAAVSVEWIGHVLNTAERAEYAGVVRMLHA